MRNKSSVVSVMPVLLTPEEAAEALRFGRSKVYDLIRRGHLNSVKVGGSRRVPVEALTEFVAGLLDDEVA